MSADRFARHLRALRRARGYSQEVLAERSGLSSDTIRKIETAGLSPTLTTLSKLSQGLELQLSVVLSGAERARRPIAVELASYLDGRTAKECEVAFRVVRSLFEDP